MHHYELISKCKITMARNLLPMFLCLSFTFVWLRKMGPQIASLLSRSTSYWGYTIVFIICVDLEQKKHTDLLICALRLVLSLIGECLSKNKCYISVGIFVSFA